MNTAYTDRKEEKVLGHTIKVMRKKRHLTQEELSGLSGIGVPYISNIETGKANPTLKVVRSLAEAFDTPLSELFSDLEKNND